MNRALAPLLALAVVAALLPMQAQAGRSCEQVKPTPDVIVKGMRMAERISQALGVQPAQLLPQDQGKGTTLGYPVTPVRGSVRRLTLVRGTPDGQWRPTGPGPAAATRPRDRRPPGHPERYRSDAA